MTAAEEDPLQGLHPDPDRGLGTATGGGEVETPNHLEGGILREGATGIEGNISAWHRKTAK